MRAYMIIYVFYYYYYYHLICNADSISKHSSFGVTVLSR